MKRGKQKPRTDATGRNPDRVGSEGRYLSLRRSIWHSPQISALSPNARSLMIELLSIFNGSNNGSIFLSIRDATERLGFSDHHSAGNAFRELEAVGMVSNTVAGSFRIKSGRGSLARAWRLNWLGDDGKRVGPDVLPPLDLAILDKTAKARLTRRQTALKRFAKDLGEGNFAVVDSTMRPPIMAYSASGPVVDSTMRSAENGGNASPYDVVDSTAHILHQGDRGLMSRTDIMRAVRGDCSATSLIRSPSRGHPLFCDLIKLRRGIKDTSKKSDPIENCEKCGGGLDLSGRAGRRFCSEKCRKSAERHRHYERGKLAA